MHNKTGKSEKPKTTPDITELKDKIKSSKGSGLETDQTEQLDVLLNQSAKNKFAYAPHKQFIV